MTESELTQQMSWKTFTAQTLVAALISGTVIAVLASALLHRRAELISAEVKSQFEQELVRYRSNITWKEQSLAELLGPVNMQLERTERAFKRYEARNRYLEAKVLRTGNETVRDLLLNKGHLIPPSLMEDAALLVEHYDVWLEKYERVRGGTEPDLDEPFVFAGPDGYPFPKQSGKNFKTAFREAWQELYSGNALAQ